MVEESEKKEGRRTENWLGHVEPGNTSLNRRWTLSQPSSPDKTHTAPNKDGTVQRLVEEWCHRQHNELCNELLCALCYMGKK